MFTSYGAFWLSFWAYLTFFAEKVPAEHHGVAAGWFLISWAIFTTLMLVAALRTTAILALLSRSSPLRCSPSPSEPWPPVPV